MSTKFVELQETRRKLKTDILNIDQELEKLEMENTKQSMIYLPGAGSSFHCSCGCNVFTQYLVHLPELKYSCNSCDIRYTGGK